MKLRGIKINRLEILSLIHQIQSVSQISYLSVEQLQLYEFRINEFPQCLVVHLHSLNPTDTTVPQKEQSYPNEGHTKMVHTHTDSNEMKE